MIRKHIYNGIINGSRTGGLATGISASPVTSGLETLPPFIPEPEEWTHSARCNELGTEAVDVFFFDYGTGRYATLPAKRICRDCPVKMECLEKGMNEPYGIWGGTTPEERKKLVRRLSQCGLSPSRENLASTAANLAP